MLIGLSALAVLWPFAQGHACVATPEDAKRQTRWQPVGTLPGATLALSPPVFVQAENGQIRGCLRDGTLAWRRRTAEGRVVTVRADSDGTFIVNENTILDRFGRIIAYHGHATPFAPEQGASGTAGSASWSVPVLINEHSDKEETTFEGPVVDAQGRAWVVITRRSGDALTVELAHTGAGLNDWTAEVVFESTGFALAGAPREDLQGRIVLVFRVVALFSPIYRLEVVTFDPATLNIAHETAYASDDFFQDEDFAIDHDGNIVVVMDVDPFGVALLWFNGSEWDGPLDIGSPFPESPPALMQNSDRTTMYLMYSVGGDQTSQRQRGIYTQRYLGPPEMFEDYVRVPGSGPIDFSVFVLPPPGVVDPDGEATVFYDAHSFLKRAYRVRTNRTLNGIWGRPQTLATRDQPVGISGGLEHAAISPEGDILFAYQSFERTGKCVCSHFFDALTGQWAPSETLLFWDTLFAERVRVAFTGPASAIAVFNAPEPFPSGPMELASMLWEGSWKGSLVDIPEEHFSYFFSLAPNPAAPDAHLVFSSNPGGFLLDAYYATLFHGVEPPP